MTEKYTNRLIHEKSPYLLQHAHNPVDWYPWSDEAFQMAQSVQKPIFLSIGYASCHWCHVMEKESFEDPELAQLLNNTFINIKIDREELPEIDSLYMEFAQGMMPGSTGWPLNLILTPSLVPIFAATYMPPHDHNGMMGLSGLVYKIQELWQSDERDQIIQQADKVLEFFSSSVRTYGDELPNEELIYDSTDLMLKMGDSVYGGIDKSPKFPLSYHYDLLINDFALRKEYRSLFFVERSLEMMGRGGIHDHIGGGFSRYSVDEKWFVPHFEKMLYDNALIAASYFYAWEITTKELYYNICKDVLDYILRELTHPDGGFYSSEDADSEGKEGLFYTWTFQEIEEILKEKAPLFCAYYSITPEGNFEGRNILYQKESLADFAHHFHVDISKLEEILQESRELLFSHREQRKHPLKDDKILTSWNGLTIHAMALFGAVSSDPSYLRAAEKGAFFILKNLIVEGKLLHRWRNGESLFAAGLDDYAFFIKGLLTLFNVTGNTLWLKSAIELNQLLRDNFKAEEGAYYQTDGLDKNVILRKTQFSDGSEPSGNAIQTENLLRLFQITGDEEYINDAEDILCAVHELLEEYPPGYCYHAITLQRYYHIKAPTLCIALSSGGEKDKALIRSKIFSRYLPFASVIWIEGDHSSLEQLAPIVDEKPPIDNQTTLYICDENSCQAPIVGIEKILETIEKL